MYSNFLDMFMKWDSILVKTGGIVNRRLMSLVNICVDNRVEFSGEMSTEQAQEQATRFD
jgi:hypothetical protein